MVTHDMTGVCIVLHDYRKISTDHMTLEDKKRLRFSYQVCGMI